MNPNIKSAFPRAILQGTEDASIRSIPYEPTIDTQHIPLLFLRTQKGPDEVTILPSSLFTSIYGEGSIESNGLLHTHQTEILKACLRGGNSTIAVKRVLGEKAVPAKLNFYSVVKTVNKVTTATVSNKKVTSTTDKSYELISFTAKHKGDYANVYGVSIIPGDAKTQMLYGPRLNGFVYELRVFKKDLISGQRNLIYSNYNDEKAYFTLNPNSTTNTDNEYYLPAVVQDMFNNSDFPALDLFGEVKVNEDALYALHGVLLANKLATSSNFWQYDILSKAKLTMSKDLVYNLENGHDGFNTQVDNFVTMKINILEEYDNYVFNYLDNITDGSPIGNMAKYPISIVYDSGFSMRVKLAMRKLLQVRQDVMIGLSTFMVGNHFKDVDGSTGFEYVYDADQASSIASATALKSAFFLYPESEVHGTPTMRAFITMQSGIYPPSGYTSRQSIIIDIAEKLSGYTGAGKAWRSQKAFDQSPNNELKGWYGVNFTYRSEALKETSWDAGIIWLENKDTTTLFYPSFQTIYPDDTSVLNNIFTVLACCYLNKVAHRVWATVTGNGKLSDDLLLQTLSNLIDSEVSGIFDNRFTIKSDNYFTVADNARGYSWTTDINIYSELAKTVGTYKITAHRMS